MGSSLRALIGRRVIVWTNMGNSYAKDEGIFEEFDGIFVRILSENESMFFPYTAIRLIKPTD